MAIATPSPSHAGGGVKRFSQALKRGPLGRAGKRAGRAIKRGEELVSGHLTLLADQVEKQLPAAEAGKFHRLRLANPLTAAGFVGGKIKADWNPLWMWAPASFALSSGMHYWLAEEAGLGFWPAALIRVPAGLAIDLAVIGGYNHYRRKQANPDQTLRKTGGELKKEYLEHAARRRTRNRKAMRVSDADAQLSPRLLRFLHSRFGEPAPQRGKDSSK